MTCFSIRPTDSVRATPQAPASGDPGLVRTSPGQMGRAASLRAPDACPCVAHYPTGDFRIVDAVGARAHVTMVAGLLSDGEQVGRQRARKARVDFFV
jgi:hypothetical protein